MTTTPPDDLSKLVEDVYSVLRKIATRELGRQRGTIDPTDLVHECYVKLAQNGLPKAMDRTRFLALAAKAIRHVLVDRVRGAGAQKRGGQMRRMTLHEGAAIAATGEVDLLELDEALTRFAVVDERAARVVELRFFAGLTHEEIARVLKVSERSVKADWTVARAWLHGELGDGRR